ncbi:MAG: tetratricopeptide repeat protein [Planctomycetota bacterium]|nr:tetratricopeptide repeat protein [Planctomycetota bacterium]
MWKLFAFRIALLASLTSCTGPGPADEDASTAAHGDASPLDALRREYGVDDPDRWISFELRKSVISEGRRRIRFDKQAVARALLEHGGGSAFEAAPMRYPDGTLFVTERLDPEGRVTDTEVLFTRTGEAPEFLLFDADGRPDDTFRQPGDPPEGSLAGSPEGLRAGNVPEVCLGCHLGTDFFDPLMSFPLEPEESLVEVDPRYRNEPIALRFLEGFHRGESLFGPYGTLLLSSLFADARDGLLADTDRGLYDTLQERYPEILVFDPDAGRRPETISLLGRPLPRPSIDAEAIPRLQGNFEQAWEDLVANPEDEMAIVWVGRRLSYLGRYQEAVGVYTRGVALHPESYKLLRHRGHRWITLRRFDRAIADLARAAELSADAPDEIEPDGAPNEFDVPTTTTGSNIWYHLALAQYLSADFENAERSYRRCMELSTVTDDKLTATSYWLTMTLRRLSRPAEAAEVLAGIRADMEILENFAYRDLLMHYQGAKTAAEVLAGVDEDSLEFATRAYGLANELLWSGRIAEARKLLERIVAGRTWAAFGHIAAEAELSRLPRRAGTR